MGFASILIYYNRKYHTDLWTEEVLKMLLLTEFSNCKCAYRTDEIKLGTFLCLPCENSTVLSLRVCFFVKNLFF